jgi:4-carboxymuconolactone decarboxylase
MLLLLLFQKQRNFMSSSRIVAVPEPLPEPIASQMAKLIPKGMPAPKLFLSVARNASLFAFMVESGLIGPTGLMDRRTLAKDVRETLILRTCVATRNDYEFNLHNQTISARMGLSGEQTDNIRSEQMSSALWRDDLIILMKLVDSLVKHLNVSDELYASVRHYFSEEELIEVTQLVGLYTGVAMMVALIRPEFDRYQSGPVFTVSKQS